jgi:hypothetical protein
MKPTLLILALAVSGCGEPSSDYGTKYRMEDSLREIASSLKEIACAAKRWDAEKLGRGYSYRYTCQGIY